MKCIFLIILYSIILMLPLQGQAVFDITYGLTNFEDISEGVTSIKTSPLGYIAGGRYADISTIFYSDSAFISLVSEEGDLLFYENSANDSSHYDFYTIDVDYQDSTLLHFYVSEKAELYPYKQFLKTIDISTGLSKEYRFKVAGADHVDWRGMEMREDYLYLFGASEIKLDETGSGYIPNQALVARFSSNMEEWEDTIWTNEYVLIDGEETNNVVQRATFLSDGSIIIIVYQFVGWFPSMSLCRISPDLEVLWKYTYTDVGMYSYLSLQESHYFENRIYCGGHNNLEAMVMALDFEGNIIWEQTHPIPEGGSGLVKGLFEEDDGKIVIGGKNADINNIEVGNAFIMKCDTGGNYLWHRLYEPHNGAYDSYIWDMDKTLDGGYILCGSNYFPAPIKSDTWLIKTDSLGNTSLPLGAIFESSEIWLLLGEDTILNPIQYGGEGVYSHQWYGATDYLDSTMIASPTFFGEMTGDFELYYFVTDTMGVSIGASLTIHVVESFNDLEELSSQDYQVYPNPVSDQLNLRIPKPTVPTTFQLSTLSGKVMRTFVVGDKVDVGSLQNGVYIYQFLEEGQVVKTGKLLVVH